MNKTELVKELAKHTDLSQAKAAEVVDALFDAEKGLIANLLKGADKLVIPGRAPERLAFINPLAVRIAADW